MDDGIKPQTAGAINLPQCGKVEIYGDDAPTFEKIRGNKKRAKEFSNRKKPFKFEARKHW